MMANGNFISVEKKSFCVFRCLPWAPPNTLKLFSAKCFIILLDASEKYFFFLSFQKKISIKFGQDMCFETVMVFKLSVTKDFFLI